MKFSHSNLCVFTKTIHRKIYTSTKDQLVLPQHIHETITRPIDDAYISKYCTCRRTRETSQAPANTANHGFSD